MSFSTSFFNKAVLLTAVLFAANLWGCARNKTEGFAVLPEHGATPQKVATTGQPGPAGIGDFLIAVLPVENLSGTNAPLEEIENYIGAGLVKKGFRVLDKNRLEQFRKKHRMRNTGGVNSTLSEALLEETGVDAVLITSLEAYQEAGPPLISLITRLVASGSRPEIIWMDSVGLSGDESPGFLDLKRIRKSSELIKKVVGVLTDSLAAGFVPGIPGGDGRNLSRPQPRSGRLGNLLSPGQWFERQYMPYDYFRSPLVDPGSQYSIAVIPMLNLSPRKNAGVIAQLHYVRELVNMTDFDVFEPGMVREGLLKIRANMPQGPSLAETDLITGEYLLGADLVLTGRVFDYQGASREPKVDFSMQIIEKKSRQIVFGARAFRRGTDGVYFFDLGREYTAHNLLRKLSRATVRLLVNPSRS